MDRDEVIKNVRACLISSKGGVKLDHLNRDYKIILDENIPFKKLGYPSLVAFLSTVPGIRTNERGGEYFIEAIPTEESAHISKLISRQKTTSTKKNKKLVNARNQTPYRQPIMTKKYPRPTRIAIDTTHMIGRQNAMPAIQPTKITIYQNNEKPRYIQSNSGVPLVSPSKRLKDRQANLVTPPNQSLNKPKDDSHLKSNEKVVTPVINQKPKTVNNNSDTFSKGKSSNLSERLKVNPNIPSLLNIPVSIPSPPPRSEVLSPLSPGQALADAKVTQFQQSPPNSVPPIINTRRNVSKLQPNDPREELKRKTSALNLPEPIYQICPTNIKNAKERAVFAQVKIGPHGYSSYPEEARTEDEAEKFAAKLALLDLNEKYGSPFRLNETKDRHIINDRVLFIIDAHPNGIFMHQVPIYYKQQYREILPGNWEQIIEECPAIVLEKGVDNSVILRRYISSTEKIRNVSSSKTDKVQLHPIGPPAPGQLQLPEEDIWLVSVTYVISTTEIWARLVGEAYSDQFDIMTAEMTQYYKKLQQPVKMLPIEIGNYYVIFEDDCWHRVRCIDYNVTTGMATVLFIDLGDEDTFHHSRLQTLDKTFCVLPAQALRLCLSGFEDFSECDSILGQIEKCLLDRALYVEVISRDKDENGPFVTVVFQDTHGPDDINLNSELSKQILQQIVVAPKLDVEGQVSEVFISHIEQNGDVFVQVQSESMKMLVSLLNRLICTGLNAEEVESCAVTTIDVNKTYFVSVNNNWYRGKIVSHFYDSLKAFLIDFGKTVTTSKSNLLSLEKLSEVLAKYPAQALKVHLHNIDKSMFNEKMVAKLTEIAPKGEPLLVKVVSSENNVPVVELFKRLQPNNMLVSINNTVALDEHTRPQGDGNNNIKPRKRIERANSKLTANEDDEVRSLKPPKISGIGEYFDVHVTMAAHPGNFTVQPFDDKRSLETMMIQLQEACRAYKGSVPTAETVREGKLYAAKHIDGHWYRVCISSIIKENMVSVYFCDFGDVSVLPLNNLQPLKSQFLELPYQAIKCRLAGIRPINVDWSVEDSLRFQELVVERNFVSIVVESKPDGLTPADTILGLKLINVSTDDDVHIDHVLVEEGRAVFTN
ncbi:tudor domain-containing protein 7 tapas [Nomia melanderi]|uniref:tudor domain-containing protein 7 tapas n=1 Tax=Nomia melanderi TaxID=2448451 RepID=UPI00130413B7|nr:tudor domain-containing protein 7-like [Nomia melanderi]XP_031830739.1 tudor domain-containing protein 7-like [Nomia melanderi]XP_031830740.1 tudor domain-containing protein 7-like [Nomia melanderi]XP_031830741.1 tudor domain-containing protein 7-like [Nomia melanderi]XP_031830742.1 tudor domain-containing protein 7-like [Nomia melanderi]